MKKIIIVLLILCGFTFTTPVESHQPNLANIVDGAMPSVVFIHSPSGFGSGFFITTDGYIVTNAHVVRDRKTLTVTTHDSRRYPAKLIGIDGLSDIAVLKIQPVHKITPLRVGNDDSLRIGDSVFAIGAPKGLTFSVTSGVISGKNRHITKNGKYVSYIQTDAAINSGNSGGPLVDMSGKVVGVSTLYMDHATTSGLYFAVPISLAYSVASQLIKTGTVDRGFLGAQVFTIRLSSSPIKYGAMVIGMKANSAAYKNLKLGDVITDIDGIPMYSHVQILKYLSSIKGGTVVDITLIRQKKIMVVRVTLDRMAIVP